MKFAYVASRFEGDRERASAASDFVASVNATLEGADCPWRCFSVLDIFSDAAIPHDKPLVAGWARRPSADDSEAEQMAWSIAALAASDLLLVHASPIDTEASHGVQSELHFAWRNKIPIRMTPVGMEDQTNWWLKRLAVRAKTEPSVRAAPFDNLGRIEPRPIPSHFEPSADQCVEGESMWESRAGVDEHGNRTWRMARWCLMPGDWVGVDDLRRGE